MAQLDWERFLERLERNEALALELATDLYNVIDARFLQVDEAIRSRELPRIIKTTHAFRGLLAPYGAPEILLYLKRTEEDARGGLLPPETLPEEVGRWIRDLKGELAEKIERRST